MLFMIMLQSKELSHHMTYPYTSEQNGMLES